MVRAKCKVVSVTTKESWNKGELLMDVKLVPVHKGSPENDAFYAATPSGEFNLSCARLDAAAQFEIGKEYYVDFTPAA